MGSRSILFAVVIACVASSVCFSQTKTDKLTEWQNNKFSMFIHFGAYSQLGGVWKGKEIKQGYSEQIQSHAGIFSDEYEQAARHFLPSKWNADSIAVLAKRAGMRSIVITSKHHDGFCMFKTKTTTFNIVDATPFKRDVVKELSDACKRYGLNFGLYFSLIDWHYPQAYPISSHNADFITPEHHEFSKKQLEELLTNYGTISELWFDMGSLTLQQSSELRALVKKFQPDCMISGRLGNDQGDFCVMGDNEYPDYAIDVPWQVPASMFNETWGYRSWQVRNDAREKAAEKLSGLINTVTRGGNYLLNIGPKGDGSVVDFERDVLLEMGYWLKENGEAIYGPKADNKLYHFLFDTPVDNRIVVNGITSRINKAFLLDAPGELLPFTRNGDMLTVSLAPNFRVGANPRVLVIECLDKIEFKPKTAGTFTSSLSLNSQNAERHYSFSGVDYYTAYRSTVKLSWNFQSATTRKIKPVIFYSDEEKGREAVLSINGVKTSITFSDGEAVTLPNKPVKWGERVVDESGNEIIQYVTASAPTQVLVRIPTNDVLSVHLNKTEIYTINNPAKEKGLQSTVLLPLKAGTNTLMIKYLNRFGSVVETGLFTDIPQVIYKKTLPEISFEKGKGYEVSVQLPPGVPVHQNIHAPNFSIQLNNVRFPN